MPNLPWWAILLIVFIVAGGFAVPSTNRSLSNKSKTKRKPQQPSYNIVEPLIQVHSQPISSQLQSGPLPYRKAFNLLTRSERAFYQALQVAINPETRIFVKVRLLDLLWLPGGTHDRQSYVNRVMSKHVDFVLCDGANISPLLVIELDDSSHERTDRQLRDAFVDEVLRTVDLPILHVPVRSSYSSTDLATLIQHKIGASAAQHLN